MPRGPQTTLILQRVTETNSAQGLSESWNAVTTITGVLTQSYMTRNRSIEKFEGAKHTVIGRYTFYIDYPAGVTITEKDRFATSTRTFEILYVYNPGNKNQYLEIEVDEIL